MNRLYTILVICFIWNMSAFPQTSEIGNYQVYSRETSSSSFGYLFTSIKVPAVLSEHKFSQQGVSYTHFYDFGKIGEIAIDQENGIGFYFAGEFKTGLAAGNKIILPAFGIKGDELKFFTLTMDFFSLYFFPEYSYVFSNGNAVTGRFGINLLNIGGTVAFPEHGSFPEQLIAEMNLIPLGFAPSVFFDFGRSGLGFMFYFNFNNILSLNYAGKTYGEDMNGLKAFGSSFQRYDFQIQFVF